MRKNELCGFLLVWKGDVFWILVIWLGVGLNGFWKFKELILRYNIWMGEGWEVIGFVI